MTYGADTWTLSHWPNNHKTNLRLHKPKWKEVCSISHRRRWTTASTRPPLKIRRTQLSKLMSPHNHQGPFQGGQSSRPSKTKVCAVLQLNAEGLTNAKLEVIRQLADSKQVAVVLLQETHRTTEDNLKLPGFLLAGSIPSKHHGMATYVRTGITWSAIKRSPPDSNIEWLVTEVQETTIVNVYKPPPSELYRHRSR